jgi:hypothetical protein
MGKCQNLPLSNFLGNKFFIFLCKTYKERRAEKCSPTKRTFYVFFFLFSIMNSISFNLFPRLLTVGSVHLLEDSMYFFMQILRRTGFLKIFHFISSFFWGRSPLAVTICSSENVQKKKREKHFCLTLLWRSIMIS